MVKGPALLGLAKKGPEHFFGRQGRGQRQVAACQSLGQAKKIRDNSFLRASKQTAGPAHADGHLIGDEQDVMFARHLADVAQVAVRRNDHAGRPLHERFDHYRGQDVVMLAHEPG